MRASGSRSRRRRPARVPGGRGARTLRRRDWAKHSRTQANRPPQSRRAVLSQAEGVEMVVAIGRVKTDVDNREELVRVGQRVAAASRGEAGCISYRVYEDTEDEKAFGFVEEWRSEEALQQHFGTPHVAEFMPAVRAVIVQ